MCQVQIIRGHTDHTVMPKRVWAATAWPAHVPPPSEDDGVPPADAGVGARGITHALTSTGDERAIQATLVRLDRERAARSARLREARDAGGAAGDDALRAEWDALIARVAAPLHLDADAAPSPRDPSEDDETKSTKMPRTRRPSFNPGDDTDVATDATPAHRTARPSDNITPLPPPSCMPPTTVGDEVIAATPDADLMTSFPRDGSTAVRHRKSASTLSRSRSRSSSVPAPILSDTPPPSPTPERDIHAADDVADADADADDGGIGTEDVPIDQSYRPLASSQLAGKYSISMTAEYRAAAAIANAKTPTVPMPHVDSLATEDGGGMGAFDTLGVDDGSMRIDTAVHNFDKFDGSGSLPPQTQMVEETPRSEMDRRAGGGGGGGGVGSPNNGGTGYVRKRSGVGGQRLRFSVGAAANGSLTIAEENEEDTCRLEEDTCRLDAEDTCYTHAEEEAGVSGRGTAELIFAATHEGGSKVLGVIAPPPGSQSSARVFAVVAESSEGSEDVTVMVWRVVDSDPHSCASSDDEGSSSPRCELAGSARLRRRDWTGPPGGKENKSPRKVNIASLMSPDRRRSGSLDPAAQGKKQSGTQLCSALSLSPCGAYLIVANSQFAVTTGDAKGASVIRIEAIRDETTRTHSAWIDSRDVIMRLTCPYRVTRLAMWSDDTEGGGVTIVAGAPLGKMHAWRLEHNLDVLNGVDAGSHEGERMPDLKYLDQTPMSDPLDALAFAGPDQIVAVTHDGLVIGKYVRTSSGLHPDVTNGSRKRRKGCETTSNWNRRSVHYTQHHRIRHLGSLDSARLLPAPEEGIATPDRSAERVEHVEHVEHSGVVPFLALVEQKSGGPLRLHAGAVGAGVDVTKSMPLDDVTALATGPLTGSIAAVGTSDGDVVAFDCVTGDVFPGDFGELSNESVGEKVVGVALAPWDCNGIEGERGALLVAATASKAAAYVLRYGHLD